MTAEHSLTATPAPLDAADVPAVAAMLARAFHEDPAFIHLLPDAHRRGRALEWLFRRQANAALAHGRVLAVDRTLAACISYPTDHWPLPLWSQLGLLNGVFHFPWGSILDGLALQHAIDRHHFAGPHYYVQVLGVDPARQGSGFGRALLEEVLARADGEHVPTYLETSRSSNVEYYQRFGFEVIGETSARGSPPMWLMLRRDEKTP